jgi:hypothetical protein
MRRAKDFPIRVSAASTTSSRGGAKFLAEGVLSFVTFEIPKDLIASQP